jgi:hypothetical protein
VIDVPGGPQNEMRRHSRSITAPMTARGAAREPAAAQRYCMRRDCQ